MDIETKREFEKIGLQVDQRFEKVDKRFEKVDQRFENLENIMIKGFNRVDEEIALVLRTMNAFSTAMETEIKAMNSRMVTKDYLDRRLERFASVNHLLLRDEGPSYKV